MRTQCIDIVGQKYAYEFEVKREIFSIVTKIRNRPNTSIKQSLVKRL